MTRETKIGLIVAGSFLCLVCIVVVSKWRPGDDPSKEPEEQNAPHVGADKLAQNTNTSQPPKNEAAPKGDPSVPPKKEKAGDSPGGKTLEVGNLRALPPSPPADWNISVPPAVPMPMPPAGPLPLPSSFAASKPNVEETTRVLPSFPPTEVGEEKEDSATAIRPAESSEEKEGPMIPVMPPPKVPPLSGNVPPVDSTKSPIDPILKPDALPTFPPIPKETLPATGPEKKDSPPIAFPTEPVKPTMPANPNETQPNPIPRIPANDQKSVPQITIPPGFGGMKLPPVKEVNSSDVCRSSDTNFAALSQRLYGTPKYADALLAYNRANARWIKNGAAFHASPPSLTPGQQIEYPPIEILERSYGSLIRDASVSPIPSIPAAAPVKLATPSPINPGIAAISNPPAVGPTRNYKVQNPAGESILDIAERTLGNRSLWTEIYRINQANPAVRPPALIPTGTDLKLPAS